MITRGFSGLARSLETGKQELPCCGILRAFSLYGRVKLLWEEEMPLLPVRVTHSSGTLCRLCWVISVAYLFTAQTRKTGTSGLRHCEFEVVT